jgi:hypothetical protein
MREAGKGGRLRGWLMRRADADLVHVPDTGSVVEGDREEEIARDRMPADQRHLLHARAAIPQTQRAYTPKWSSLRIKA